MKSGQCPSAEAISRAFSGDATPEFLEHLEGCEACRAEWESLARLRRLGRELPVDLPDADRRDAVRARLLYQAERWRSDAPSSPDKLALGRPGAPRRRLWAAGAALTCALLLMFAVVGRRALWGSSGREAALRAERGAEGRSSSPRTQRASITMLDAARYTHQGADEGEVVRLYEGTVQLSVQPLGAGERFRVLVGDGEVEVRGTVFTVTAAADRLQAVTVQRGVVEVRPRGAPAALLQAGESWRASLVAPSTTIAPRTRSSAPIPPAAAKDVSVAKASAVGPVGSAPARAMAVGSTVAAGGRKPSAPAAAAPLRAAPSMPIAVAAAAVTPPAQISMGSPAERAFNAGFLALKQGRFAPAAEQLEQAIALAPQGPVAEDARFWAGVAWARAGRSREAVQSLRSFLSQYPQSPRTAEVAAALGWLLFRAQRFDEAERAFRAAGRDRTPEVSESIRAGLAAVAKARGQ